jgi:membrane protein
MTAKTSTKSLGRVPDFLIAVGQRFYFDQCLMRASALAYISMLSIVPLMAVMFAVLKGLGVQHRLEPLLLSRLSLDQQTSDMIIGSIDRTNVGTLGALGAVTLLVTVNSVLGTIEASFNDIWRVGHARTLWRKATDYLGVVLLTPFLMLAGVAITSAAQVQGVVQWLSAGVIGDVTTQVLRLSPIVINAAGIGVLYAVMPNRRPAWGPIVISALVAGAAWQVVQWAYIALQIGVASNNAIYGALAQLPITLAWLYVSWTIVLAGCEIAAVLEFGPDAAAVGVADAQAVALHMLVRAADAFERGAPAVEPPAVARELRVDLKKVEDIADALQSFGWLAAAEGSPRRLLLAQAPARIGLDQVAALADGEYVPGRCDPRARAALGRVRTAGDAVWSASTLADVLTADDGGEQRKPAAADAAAP